MQETETDGIKGFSCPKCNWSDVFPIEVCPRCRSTMKQVWFSRQGKIATFTVIHYPPKGFERQAPYVVALIDLEKGPRVMGRIVRESRELQIGQTASFLAVSDGALEFEVKP
jgi:uncharacterized OB-fold protein